jgi:ATP-dependent DNA ligase
MGCTAQVGRQTEQMALRPPVQLMTARSSLELPRAEGRWAYEPKFDGFRCLAFRRMGGKATLRSRQQRALTRFFPEVVAALQEQLTRGVVLDGELVICVDGRLDFASLQGRLRGAQRSRGHRSACFVVFDILALGGNDLRGLAYTQRRGIVADLLAQASPPLALMPMTTDLAGARSWLTNHAEAGIEGVVVKNVKHAYRPDRRSWQKIKTRVTTEAVVGGVIGPLDAPEVLILGRVDDGGRMRVVGRTSRLPVPLRAELAAVLEPPRRIHPWPVTIPSSRFGQLPAKPVEYTPVNPAVVVELDADVAFEFGRWRHPIALRRLRLDLVPEDLARLQ